MNEPTLTERWQSAEIEGLNEVVSTLDSRVIELESENERLTARIAELEAESERFTVHSDIERQDDKSPNDTQSSTIVYGKESEE